MNQDIKNKWVAALRSGRYRQGFNQLYDPKNGGYCCLGVLCDVMNYKSARLGYLDQHIMNETGVNNEQQVTLSELNDSDKKNFNEIADYIEENM